MDSWPRRAPGEPSGQPAGAQTRGAGVRFLLTVGALLLTSVILWALLGGQGAVRLPPLPSAGQAETPPPGNPLAYRTARENEFVARATDGEAHVLYVKSPGGVIATAARVRRFTALIDRATANSGVDPQMLQAIVFLESAGYPQVIAGGDPAGAAGLTQIVASTGRSLLGMHINLPRSQALTGQINAALAAGRTAKAHRLERQRAGIDDRFDPVKALAGAVRYLKLARGLLGRWDLAIESYHMGVGNLQRVLADYGGGAQVPYAQLYFDSDPDHHAAAYRLLSSFGDDSWSYLWRVLAARQIMIRYANDRAGLTRLATLQVAAGSAARVLHPPGQTTQFAGPAAVDTAYARHVIVPLPRNPSALGLAYAAGLGKVARRFGFPPTLYRGLRPAALDVLGWMASRVRTLSGAGPLILAGAVSDMRTQELFGYSDPPAAAGWSFTIDRRYVSPAQSYAFQAVLDRLQALNLIAWQRYPEEIEVTVAADAGRVLEHGV